MLSVVHGVRRKEEEATRSLGDLVVGGIRCYIVFILLRERVGAFCVRGFVFGLVFYVVLFLWAVRVSRFLLRWRFIWARITLALAGASWRSAR